MPIEQVTISVTMSADHALALAQFVKRVGWSEMRQNAVNDDEAYQIRAVIGELQKALSEAGYAPR